MLDGMFGIILNMLGGLAIFIFGLQAMSNGLQKVAGKKANKIMGTLTAVPVIGVILGVIITIIAQTSSLVTVMTVAFVNAGMMNLKQAIAIIMGANVGTTLTAQVIAFRITDYWPLLAVVGFGLYLVMRQKKIKDFGYILFAVGALFLGMALMGDAMRPLRGHEGFQNLMLTFSNYRLLALLAGALFMALVQSSTAATGVIVAMALEGLIPFGAAIPLILGTNIGTCITAILASIGTNLTARRTAMAHVLFNTCGALIFLVFLTPFESLILHISPVDDVARQAANAHLLFNLINTGVGLILITPFTFLVTKIVPGKETKAPEGALHLDWHMVNTPSIALGLAQQELVRMAEIAQDNVALVMEGLFTKNPKNFEKMAKQEKIVDSLEKSIYEYLARVSQADMSTEMALRHTALLHAANDVERVSDHAENIAELAQIAIDEDTSFSEDGLRELKELAALAGDILTLSTQSVRDDDAKIVPTVKELEAQIDALEETARKGHIERLKNRKCSVDSGVIFLDIVSNLERIGDHANNISNFSARKL